jgi:hypothetical protein
VIYAMIHEHIHVVNLGTVKVVTRGSVVSWVEENYRPK